MVFRIQDANGIGVPYLVKWNENGSGTGLESYWNYSEIPTNISGTVTDNEVVVTYVIRGYGVAFPEP